MEEELVMQYGMKQSVNQKLEKSVSKVGHYGIQNVTLAIMHSDAAFVLQIVLQVKLKTKNTRIL